MKTWESIITQYKVSDLISWQKAGSLKLSPSFQRRPVWSAGAKSFLIDTVVRGLPMPLIFIREQMTSLRSLEPTREIVDGQQRIRTIFTFIDRRLVNDYDDSRDGFTVQLVHNSDLAKKKFSELSSELQQRILDYRFSVHVLPPSVDDREVLQLFSRMNATGVKLNDQELRNAAYYGEMKTSMYDLAAEQIARWREWKIFSEYNIARMDEVELTSEFALLMHKGITGKSQQGLNRFYREKDVAYPERAEVERRFRSVMDTIEDKFGGDLKSSPFRKKTLFYSLFALVYDCQFGINSTLGKSRPEALSQIIPEHVRLAGERINNNSAPKKILESVARRTTHLNARNTIFSYLKKPKP